MRLIAPIRTVAVGGAVLECLVFGGLGAYTLWLGITLNGHVDAFGNDLNFLAAAALLALTAGFGSGAFLVSSRWVEEKILGGRTMGAVVHLVATAIATWGAIWMGEYQVQYVTYSPNTDASWPPVIAFAVAAAVIVIGLAVLVSLFIPAGSDAKWLRLLWMPLVMLAVAAWVGWYGTQILLRPDPSPPGWLGWLLIAAASAKAALWTFVAVLKIRSSRRPQEA